MTAIPSYLGGPVAPEPIVQAATDPIEEKSKNGGGGVGGASSRVTEEKEAVEIRLDILKEGWELERALEMAHFDERRKNILDAENITEQERTDLLTRNAEIRAETMKAITVSEHAETLGASANFLTLWRGLLKDTAREVALWLNHWPSHQLQSALTKPSLLLWQMRQCHQQPRGI